MHILNGDSAAGSFRQAFHLPRGEILVFRDVLSCGTLTAFADLENWRVQRMAYWYEMCLQHGFDPAAEMDFATREFYQCFHELE